MASSHAGSLDTAVSGLSSLASARAGTLVFILGAKHAEAAAAPFHRLKVRVKAEIVTLGRPDLDPANRAGARTPRQAGFRRTKAANSALVTGLASIQKSSTSTQCAGASSGY